MVWATESTGAVQMGSLNNACSGKVMGVTSYHRKESPNYQYVTVSFLIAKIQKKGFQPICFLQME
jgi:hypothetical protein